MMRRSCVVGCLVCFAIGLAHFQAIADALAFKDVKMYSRASPNSKPNKREGYLNLDRTGRAVIFVAENRVLLTIPYGWIKNVNYERKNDHLLTVQYRDDQDQGQFAQFELGGDNRDQILASIEADTSVKVSRVSN